MSYVGDFPEDFTTVPISFTTHDGDGAPVAPSSAFEAADVAIYKNGSATQKVTTNGLTMTSPFDSVAGLHLLLIDTSNDTGDSGFWTAGAHYTVILNPDETVGGFAALKVIGMFSLAMNLRASTTGRTVVVDAAGAVTVGTNNDKTGYSLTADFRIKKNTALAAFPFFMTDSADHISGKTGLTVTGQVSLDGGAFVNLTNAVTEIGAGWYKVSFAAADTNGDTLAFKFTATGADPVGFTVVTQTE